MLSVRAALRGAGASWAGVAVRAGTRRTGVVGRASAARVWTAGSGSGPAIGHHDVVQRSFASGNFNWGGGGGGSDAGAGAGAGAGDSPSLLYELLYKKEDFETIQTRFESGLHPWDEDCLKYYLKSCVHTGRIDSVSVSDLLAHLDQLPDATKAQLGILGRSLGEGARTGFSTTEMSAVQNAINSISLQLRDFGSKAKPMSVKVIPETTWWDILRMLMSVVGFGLILWVLFGLAKGGGRSPLNMPATHRTAQQVDEVTFDDVKGCDEAINDLEEMVGFLKNPAAFNRLGARMPKGLLLTGPPGTGKTLLARALAGEAGVPFLYASGSSFDEVFVGVGARRLRQLFAEAKEKKPCIIFIDEIDALGTSREKFTMSHRESLNQLLTEMDGFEKNSGVIVIGATNLPSALDPALLRPGRFDKVVTVGLPDVKGRSEILDLYLQKTTVSPDVDSSVLARGTPGFSGADLENMVNIAAIKATMRGLREVSAAMLEEAKDDVLMGSIRKSAASVMPEEERKLTAYHEGGHALVAFFTPGADPLHKATIVPRGNALGVTMQLPERDHVSISRQQLMARLAVCMGGRAAEELIYGREKVTTGASSDFQQATKLATNMVARFGMSDKLGFAVRNPEQAGENEKVQAEVDGLLSMQYTYAKKVLQENEDKLHRLAKLLLEHETLDAEQMSAIFRGQVLPASKVVPTKSRARGNLPRDSPTVTIILGDKKNESSA